MNYDTTAESLRELFGAHGELDEVVIIMDCETDRSQGFGFVTKSDDSEGQPAIEAIDGKEVDQLRWRARCFPCVSL